MELKQLKELKELGELKKLMELKKLTELQGLEGCCSKCLLCHGHLFLEQFYSVTVTLSDLTVNFDVI